MRPRPILWFIISGLCFAGAFYFWHLGERWASRQSTVQGPRSKVQGPESQGAEIKAQRLAGALLSPAASQVVTNQLSRSLTNLLALRLTNTTATLSQLERSDKAILLENALLDTSHGAPSIPAHLQAQGDPGTWIVQSRGEIGDAFRAMLQAAGATIISYIPNNAYLVRASEGVAQALEGNPLTLAVLPYQPYYKIKSSLLAYAVEQAPLPPNSAVNVLLFADTAEPTRAALEKLGVQVVSGPDRTPFGPVLTVRRADTPAGQSQPVQPSALLSAIAGLPGVQEMEWSLPRAAANDLSRVRVNVATDSLATNNYLGLTGSNVVVNVNDSGIDSTHPDLAPRVISSDTNALVDGNGHGTHVAGIIASSGNSATSLGSILQSNNFGSISNASFRGMAPAATLFSLPVGMFCGPFEQGTLSWPSDAYLQQTAAQTNAFISNNSWNYVGPGARTYDLHAASYDAAVRDALPFVSGSRPLLFVFSAGNGGGGDANGTGGADDTIETPGTAKNVITVGALEQLRNITNIVTNVVAGDTTTDQPWFTITDSSNQVANFSSRGNVGVNIEGQHGRFKPDVVAPGVFVVSTASRDWKTNLPGIYYNPTNDDITLSLNIIVPTNNFDRLYYDQVWVDDGALYLTITVFPNTNSPNPFPDMPIYLSKTDYPTNEPGGYDFMGINTLVVTNPTPSDQYWFFGVGNTNPLPVRCDLVTDVQETNTLWGYLLGLQALNEMIGPKYRFESGTSMAAADVSGMLALMQEFFEQRLGRTNSPALMKALLINGARSVASRYDFNVQSTLNLQGWGLVNLPTTIPAAMTNTAAGTNAIFLLDQSPINALATRDSRTYQVTLTTDAQNQPLRITLVWTDPPGNPVAGIKLVNDLDLIVTNLDNTNFVYYGNNFLPGNTFTTAWNTNTATNLFLATDKINNVENVFLDPRLGENAQLATNYSITVLAHRVNVNAVQEQTNNVVQDYALVVSSGDGLVTNAISLNTNSPIVSVTLPFVTNIANMFGTVNPDFEGGTLLNERTGASTPLLGTNTIIPILHDGALPTNAVLTIGMTNQWNFYIISNTTGFTNAAFLTYLPVELSVPRNGVYVTPQQNPTRPEADIDLVVAPPDIPNNWNLTNLDAGVLAASIKALGRAGTETIVLSNAIRGVYYIGVKAEDQMAAQYSLLALFSRLPFGGEDANGNQSLIGIPYPSPIPDGSPDNPGAVQVFAISVNDILVRRVIVTNTIQHELISDLFGNLGHSGNFAVLNNHTCVLDGSGHCQTCTTYIYDDSDEKNVGLPSVPPPYSCPPNFSAQHTDGPGSLNNFAGYDSTGLWMLTMTDNATNHVGSNTFLQVYLEKQQDLTGNGITFTLQPGACRNDFIRVPFDAISLSITAAVVSATGPPSFSITVCPLGSSGAACKSVQVTNAVGGGVTIDLNDTPPLQPGATYSVRTCNTGQGAITLHLRAFLGFSQSTIIPVFTTNTATPVDIIDNGCTNVYLTNDIRGNISGLDIGLLVTSPRISDLTITLVSPNGTRSLLFEDRGNTSTNGIGTFNLSTNVTLVPLLTNNFDLAPVGLYATGAVFQGWSTLSNIVDVLDNWTCLCLSNHVLGLLDGSVSNSLPTTNAIPVTNSYPYTFSYKVNHLPWLEGMVTWWPLDVDGSDIFGDMNGLLLGDVTFSTGQTVPLFDTFDGPLSPNWQAYLPDAAGSFTNIEAYVGAPQYYFTNIFTNSVIVMTNILSPQQRVGWRSALTYGGQSFRYEVRFNTGQVPGLNPGGPVEIWLFDELDPLRYDVISLYSATNGTPGSVLVGSSIDNTNYALSYVWQTNTWYRLRLEGLPRQKVRASLFDDGGNEQVGQDLAHGPAAFALGFRVGLSQFMGTPLAPAPVQVAVDWAMVRLTMNGEVGQAFLGDGDATGMIVPACEELNLGLGRGFSIEGWIWPGNVTTSSVPVFTTPVSVNSFENAARNLLVPSGTYVSTGWHVDSGNIKLLSTTVDFAPSPDSGTNCIDINGNQAGTISTNLWLLPGHIYTLSFFYTRNPNSVGPRAAISMAGTTLATVAPSWANSWANVQWQSSSIVFTASVAKAKLQLQGLTSGSAGVLFDGLKVTEMSPYSSIANPLVEWAPSATNPAVQGVQFWMGGLPGTNLQGSLWANIWDTNLQPHIINTTTNALTNGGWQHVALTYDTNSGIAALYVNGLTNNQPLVTTNLGHFVPRTSGDVYLGAHAGLGLSNGTFTVPAVANIFSAGLSTPVAPGGSGAGALPVQVQISTNHAKLYFRCLGINVAMDPTDAVGAEGDAVDPSNITANGGISGFLSDHAFPLVGVFLTDATPQSPAPATLDFRPAAIGRNFLSLSPAIGQIFYIGDGMTDAGQAQVFNAPTGATRLFLGFADATGFTGPPGAYGDNSGSLSIQVWAGDPPISYAGGLDEFSLYNRALSPCEVNAIFNADGRGKYGTNALVCPVVSEVTLSNSFLGVQKYTFTNGLSWVTNGPRWETNTIFFQTPATNPTAVYIRGADPYTTNWSFNISNVYPANNLSIAIDDLVLSELVAQTIDGLLHFTEDTNLATIPIKYAPTPYSPTNFAPVLIYSNTFSYATAGVYQAVAPITGLSNGPVIGTRNWTNTLGSMTVVSNAFLDPVMTNWLAMATGAVQCVLPTLAGHRYELAYTLRGPCASGWWNGQVDPLSSRALDLISGNNGAFFYGATNTTTTFLGDTSQAYVGLQGLYFSGQFEPIGIILDPDYWPEDIDDPSSHIELGDPPQLQFTNAFTIEGWVKPQMPVSPTLCGSRSGPSAWNGTQLILFRGYPEPFDCRGVGDPYWLALQPGTNVGTYDLQFHIGDAHYGTPGADVLTTNAPVLINGGTNDGWWHIAAVFDKPYTNIVVTNGTNVITFSTNQMRIYLNGVCIASNYTTISPYKDLDPALSPGVSIGGRSRFDWTQPFSGYLDELTVYARALTLPEISAIASAGEGGQADLGVPAPLSLAKLEVDIEGVKRATSYGDNSRWSTYTVQFTALQNDSIVAFQSLLPGTLLEGLTLTEVPSELYYLPEESLTDLYGHSGFGVWTLELCDTRIGPAAAGATNDSTLMEWQMNFTYAPSNPLPVITLEHGVSYTNSMPAHSVQYFVVPVPQWASFATNVLQFAEQYNTTATLPAAVLYNPTNFPTLADPPLLAGPAYPSTITLATNSAPPITNGQPYYLMVTNPNPVGMTFAVQVLFDIMTLQNCHFTPSNIVAQAGIPRYFQFDVPTNFPGSSLPPQAVSFWVSNSTCNLKVVLSEHLPLPDLDHYDYISQQPCTNDQVVMVVTNTTPFPIQTNRWYVGVFNTSTTNVYVNVEACLTAAYPVIIPLTNGIPFVVSFTNDNSAFTAPPGAPRSFFFDFFIVDLPSPLGVLFELYNLSGNATLVLQQEVPPTMPPYLYSTFYHTNADASFYGDWTREQIVLRTSPNQPASVYVPDLRGHWYLGIYNNEGTNISYTIRATLPNGDRLLTTALPFLVSRAPMTPPHGDLVSWNSVIGERYFVQFRQCTNAPWTNIASLVATTPLTTYEAVPGAPDLGTNCIGYYNVLQIFDFEPLLHIQSMPTNAVRLYWSTAYLGYTLQYEDGLFGIWSNFNINAFPPYPGYPPPTQEGVDWAAYDRSTNSTPRYYRLHQ